MMILFSADAIEVHYRSNRKNLRYALRKPEAAAANKISTKIRSRRATVIEIFAAV